MQRLSRTPADLARRFAANRPPERTEGSEPPAISRGAGWSRQTYRLPREQARETARDWFDRYPKAAYMTKVESWRLLDNGLIEFTMRRLPSAD